MNIKLIELSASNMNEYLSLSVLDSQASFIETPELSLEDMKNDSWNISWKIMTINNDTNVVGYLMYGINSYLDIWLDRFMIDKRYQHKGYGNEAMELIINLLKQEFKDYRRIVLSVTRGNYSAINFYKKFGFKLTGEIEDDELVMQLME